MYSAGWDDRMLASGSAFTIEMAARKMMANRRMPMPRVADGIFFIFSPRQRSIRLVHVTTNLGILIFQVFSISLIYNQCSCHVSAFEKSRLITRKLGTSTSSIASPSCVMFCVRTKKERG